MAYEWRSVCGLTACGPSTGSPAAAAARCRIVHALCRDSGPPRAFRKTAGVPRPLAASAGRAAYQIGVQRGLGVTADRDQPGPPALAVQHGGGLVAEVEVVDRRADRLGDARPGAVEELQQRLVPQPERGVVGHREQPASPGRRRAPWAAVAAGRAA